MKIPTHWKPNRPSTILLNRSRENDFIIQCPAKHHHQHQWPITARRTLSDRVIIIFGTIARLFLIRNKTCLQHQLWIEGLKDCNWKGSDARAFDSLPSRWFCVPLNSQKLTIVGSRITRAVTHISEIVKGFGKRESHISLGVLSYCFWSNLGPMKYTANHKFVSYVL